jgi:hypothetical protein
VATVTLSPQSSQALMATMTVVLQQQTTQTSSNKTSEKDDDGDTPKMMAANRQLLLWASEMVKQPDKFWIMAKCPPTEPTKSLWEILQNTTVMKACQVLMMNLCLQQQWHGSVPQAMFIMNSTFVHEMTDVTQPILAICYDTSESSLSKSRGLPISPTKICQRKRSLSNQYCPNNQIGMLYLY